jgi:hypothetical protein
MDEGSVTGNGLRAIDTGDRGNERVIRRACVLSGLAIVRGVGDPDEIMGGNEDDEVQKRGSRKIENYNVEANASSRSGRDQQANAATGRDPAGPSAKPRT